MTSPQADDIDRRFTQARNEFNALYENLGITNDMVKSIAKVQQCHGNRLGAIGHTLDVHTARLNHMNTRLGHIESTQHNHTETLNSHTETLNSHTEILNSHTEILRTHGKKLDTIIEGHGKKLEEHDSKLDKIIDLLGAR